MPPGQPLYPVTPQSLSLQEGALIFYFFFPLILQIAPLPLWGAGLSEFLQDQLTAQISGEGRPGGRSFPSPTRQQSFNAGGGGQSSAPRTASPPRPGLAPRSLPARRWLCVSPPSPAPGLPPLTYVSMRSHAVGAALPVLPAAPAAAPERRSAESPGDARVGGERRREGGRERASPAAARLARDQAPAARRLLPPAAGLPLPPALQARAPGVALLGGCPLLARQSPSVSSGRGGRKATAGDLPWGRTCNPSSCSEFVPLAPQMSS